MPITSFRAQGSVRAPAYVRSRHQGGSGRGLGSGHTPAGEWFPAAISDRSADT